MLFNLLSIILLGAALAYANTEPKSFTTSVAAMQDLLITEQQLISNLEQYGNKLEQKLKVVRSAVSAMRAENAKSLTNTVEYLSNPLNSFSLIRRMHMDWIKWELYMEQPVGKDQISIIQKYRSKLPTETDLSDAVSAIYRLQTTYDLKALDMAVGILNGKQYDVVFSPIDCYAIAFGLVKDRLNYPALFWSYASLQKFEENEPDETNEVLEISRRSLSEFYADVLLAEDRVQDSLTVISTLLVEHPNDALLLHRKTMLQRKLADPLLNQGKAPPTKVTSTYERGCRGEFNAKPSRLHCHYNTTTTAFLRLAPLKIEVVSLDPYMVLYHDIINDNEIAHLQNLATPGLHRATVFSEVQQKSVAVNSRTSQFAWFADGMTEVTKRINQRIIDMTGFDLSGSEMLQVMNYGLGGHYDTHNDWFNVSDTADVIRLNGNRRATVLFYLSDVEQGGATVFSELEIAVLPRKGTAVMWYNLDNRCTGNPRTMHAACPVIVGSKWVCNKWIRDRSQMFRLPCYNEG